MRVVFSNEIADAERIVDTPPASVMCPTGRPNGMHVALLRVIFVISVWLGGLRVVLYMSEANGGMPLSEAAWAANDDH